MPIGLINRSPMVKYIGVLKMSQNLGFMNRSFTFDVFT